MAKTEQDLTISKTWQDLTASYSGMASAASYVQNKSFSAVPQLLVVFSASGTPPNGTTGMRLSPGDLTQGTAAHIWVRAYREDVLISCGTTD